MKNDKRQTTPLALVADGPHRAEDERAAPPWPHGPNTPKNGQTEVTPEMAKEWLAANHCNRNVKRTAVSKVKAALVSGEFVFNAQTVTFTKSWRLADGQHRLIAIVESGVPAMILVWTGLEEDVLKTINIGGAGNRSGAEAWGINNGVVPNKTEASRVNACWCAFMHCVTRGPDEYGAAREAFIEGVMAVEPYFASHNIMTRATIVAAFAIAWRVGGDAVFDLARKYMEGTDLRKGDPMLVLGRWAARRVEGGGTGYRAEETRVALSLVLASLAGESRDIPRGISDKELNRMRKAHGFAIPGEKAKS